MLDDTWHFGLYAGELLKKCLNVAVPKAIFQMFLKKGDKTCFKAIYIVEKKTNKTRLGFESQLDHLLVLLPWAPHFTSAVLKTPTFKMSQQGSPGSCRGTYSG